MAIIHLHLVWFSYSSTSHASSLITRSDHFTLLLEDADTGPLWADPDDTLPFAQDL
jgi:hypothetical protein